MLLAPVLRARGVRWDGTATAHFHCTDAPGEWMVRLEGDEVSVTREHAKGDVAATGPAADLMLLVYNRLSPADLQVFGDTSVLDRWRATIRF
jgi:predicted lipid carrier protein YhbT